MQPHSNMVLLRGNLGGDPKLNKTSRGVPVCNFRVATNERFRGADGKIQKRTEWHKITVWGRMAELCDEYLEKGREVSIVGRLVSRKWTDKEGFEREDVEIHTESIEFLRKPQRDEADPDEGDAEDLAAE